MRSLTHPSGLPSELDHLENDLLFLFDASKGSINSQIPGRASTQGSFVRASTATYWDSQGIMRTVPANTPRFEEGALLLEPAATNKCIRSRDFSVGWYNGSGTCGAVQDQVGIDGAANKAWTLTDAESGAYSTKSLDITIPADTNGHCFSLFIKKDNDETRFPFLEIAYSGGTSVTAQVKINTKTGAVTQYTGTPNTYGSDSCGGWWKVWMSEANNGTNTTMVISILPAACDSGGSATPSAQGSIIVDGIQVEFNTKYPTSFIETSGSEATRATEAGYPQWNLPGFPEGSNYTPFAEVLGSELASGTCTVGNVYKITATEVNHFYVGCAIGHYFASASGTETLDANNKVKQVLNPIASGPPQGTIVVDMAWGIDNASNLFTQGIVSTSAVANLGLLYEHISGNMRTGDGTLSCNGPSTYARNQKFRLVGKWGYLSSNVAQMTIGMTTGTSIAYVGASTYDGAMSLGTLLQLAYNMAYQQIFRKIWIFNRVLTDDEINALR